MSVSLNWSRLWSVAIAAGAMSAIGLPTASAALIASDSFVIGVGGYTANASLPTQNPAVTGFSGAWLAGSSLFKSVATGGDTVEIDQTAQAAANQNRRAARSLSAYTTASTYYFSGSVSAPTIATGQALMRFVDTNSTDSTAGNLGIGFGFSPAGLVAYFRNASNVLVAVPLLATPTPNTFYNVVAKVEVDQTSTTDVVTYWIDPVTATEAEAGTPALTSTAAAMSNATTRAVDALWLDSTNTPSTGPIRFDNARFGTAWEDVVTVPEPTTLGLAAMGIASVVRRRRLLASR